MTNKFQADLSTPENRAWWDAIRRGAEEYDKLPEWKKGQLR